MDVGRYAEWQAAELGTLIRELFEDEKLSPSFKNATVLWPLEKIDPRLSLEVKENNGYQMNGNVTLKDVQPVVFDNND